MSLKAREWVEFFLLVNGIRQIMKSQVEPEFFSPENGLALFYHIPPYLCVENLVAI